MDGNFRYYSITLATLSKKKILKIKSVWSFQLGSNFGQINSALKNFADKAATSK